MFHKAADDGGQDRDYRFTLDATLSECRNRFGVQSFTLDVAACPAANAAEKFYSLEAGQDGLALPWTGHVWCNPPWSKIKPWIVKAWHEFNQEHFDSCTMLLPVRTEQPFWQDLIEPYRDMDGPLSTWFLPKRQKFGSPSDPLGLNAGSPPFICVALHWSRTCDERIQNAASVG